MIKRAIRRLTKKELLSTISFLTWEKDFLGMLTTEQNQHFIGDLESKRISEFLFSEFPDNFFVLLLSAFDAGVALNYEKDIRRLLTLTCQRFNCMGYKVEAKLNSEDPFQADAGPDQGHQPE